MRRLRCVWVVLTSLAFASFLSAQDTPPPTQHELDAISDRGRMLAQYDRAVRRSSQQLAALEPPPGSFNRYLARKTKAGWLVVFGSLTQAKDKFLVIYAAQEDSKGKFTVNKMEPPVEQTGYFLVAAKAADLAAQNFHGENRHYNVSVLEAGRAGFYVYFIPTPSRPDAYVLGGDVRYLVSPDGTRILEKRPLHDNIVEFDPDTKPQPASGSHTNALSDRPADTDVFYVLIRNPAMPEVVNAGEHVYEIAINGDIKKLK